MKIKSLLLAGLISTTITTGITMGATRIENDDNWKGGFGTYSDNLDNNVVRAKQYYINSCQSFKIHILNTLGRIKQGKDTQHKWLLNKKYENSIYNVIGEMISQILTGQDNDNVKELHLTHSTDFDFRQNDVIYLPKFLANNINNLKNLKASEWNYVILYNYLKKRTLELFNLKDFPKTPIIQYKAQRLGYKNYEKYMTYKDFHFWNTKEAQEHINGETKILKQFLKDNDLLDKATENKLDKAENDTKQYMLACDINRYITVQNAITYKETYTPVMDKADYFTYNKSPMRTIYVIKENENTIPEKTKNLLTDEKSKTGIINRNGIAKNKHIENEDEESDEYFERHKKAGYVSIDNRFDFLEAFKKYGWKGSEQVTHTVLTTPYVSLNRLDRKNNKGNMLISGRYGMELYSVDAIYGVPLHKLLIRMTDGITGRLDEESDITSEMIDIKKVDLPMHAFVCDFFENDDETRKHIPVETRLMINRYGKASPYQETRYNESKTAKYYLKELDVRMKQITDELINNTTNRAIDGTSLARKF